MVEDNVSFEVALERLYENDPIHGCTHGATTDPELKGLTKKEWFMGCAMTGYKDGLIAPEKLVDWAYKCAKLAVKKSNEGAKVEAEIEVAEEVATVPTEPIQ